jgi:hypothetical protein
MRTADERNPALSARVARRTVFRHFSCDVRYARDELMQRQRARAIAAQRQMMENQALLAAGLLLLPALLLLLLISP